MYNLRVKRFHDSIQLQHFEKPIVSNHMELNFDTGEVKIHARDDGMVLIENPFSGEIERVKDCTNENAEKKKYDNYNRAKKKVYDYARCNDWEWFITFTFSGEYVNRYDYDACKKKICNWLSNLKSNRVCPDVKYLIVPEQHKDGAWHFHGLFSNCSNLGFVDSGIKDKQNRAIYNIGRYKWGFTTATKVSDTKRAASYLCKYITKELVADTKGMKRYWVSKNCDSPVVVDELIECNWMEYCEENELPVKHVKSVETPYNHVVYIEV